MLVFVLFFYFKQNEFNKQNNEIHNNFFNKKEKSSSYIKLFLP